MREREGEGGRDGDKPHDTKINEPHHEKTHSAPMRTTKEQINLCIHAV